MKYWLLGTMTIFCNGCGKPLYTNQVVECESLADFIMKYGAPAEGDRHDVILFAQEITKDEYLLLYENI